MIDIQKLYWVREQEYIKNLRQYSLYGEYYVLNSWGKWKRTVAAGRIDSLGDGRWRVTKYKFSEFREPETVVVVEGRRQDAQSVLETMVRLS